MCTRQGGVGVMIRMVFPFRGAGNPGEKHSFRDDLLDERAIATVNALCFMSIP